MIPFGSERYLKAQKKCYEEYAIRKEARLPGRVVCRKGLELYPRLRKNWPLHNLNCEPYIWNYFPPTTK